MHCRSSNHRRTPQHLLLGLQVHENGNQHAACTALKGLGLGLGCHDASGHHFHDVSCHRFHGASCHRLDLGWDWGSDWGRGNLHGACMMVCENHPSHRSLNHLGRYA